MFQRFSIYEKFRLTWTISSIYCSLFFILHFKIFKVIEHFPLLISLRPDFKTSATVLHFIHPCARAWICHSWNKNKNENKPVEAVTVFAPSSPNHMLKSCHLSLSFLPLAGNWKESHICWHCVELCLRCAQRRVFLDLSSFVSLHIVHIDHLALCSVESKHFSTSMLRFQCYAACANWCIFTYLCLTLCIPDIFRFSSLSFHSCGTLLWA